MPLVPTDRLARRYQSLEHAERLDFLAALWSARGFETTIENDQIIAFPPGAIPENSSDSDTTDDPTNPDATDVPTNPDATDNPSDPDATDDPSESDATFDSSSDQADTPPISTDGALRILPIQGSRMRRMVSRLPLDTPTRLQLTGGSQPVARVESIVGGESPNQPESAITGAKTSGGVLTASELQEVLAYGLDRSIGRRLTREYLETDLVVEESHTRSIPERMAASPGLSVVLVLALLVVTLGGGAAVQATFGDGDAALNPFDYIAGDDPDTSETNSITDGFDPSAADETDTSDDTATESEQFDSDTPPGLSLDGVTDSTILARYHNRNLPMSRTVESEFEGPPDVVGFQGTVAVRTERVIEHSLLYRGTTAGTIAGKNGSFDRRVDLYVDEGTEYVRVWDERWDGDEYQYRTVSRRASQVAPGSITGSRIERYLNSTDTRVEIADKRTHKRYIVVATEPPDELTGTIETYHARAIVRPDGVVLRLEVEFHRADGSVMIFEQRITKLERTTVREPAWVETARQQGNETTD